MKRTYITLLLALLAMWASAQGPNGSGIYYQNANGKKGSELKTALCGIIYNRTEKSYDYLWTAFRTTDKRSDGKVWDMYSNITNYVFGDDQAGSYSKEGDCYNREHSFPKSWFGGNVMPMYTDLHHMYPTDGYVNGRRSNHPFGETNGNTYKSSGGFSKLGACTYPGYTGTVFEPNDMYKGDFARTYFYMVTCYEEKLHDWYYASNADAGVKATLDGNPYPGLSSWQLNMLMEWAAADPVSDKEVARNKAVYKIQKNRNPFIDYPGLEQYIWGNKTNEAFDYTAGGSGGGGDDPEPGTYKLTITPEDFSGTSYAANNNEKTSYAVCTTDNTKTFEVKWTSYQVMKSSTIMQWEKGKGYIYNSTDLGTITNVTVTSTAGTFTTYYGSTEEPSSSTEVGGGFFKTVVGNATGTTRSIEVTFKIGDGGDEPIDEPVEGNCFTKITSMADFEDGGTYLIVYENGSRAFNGALEALDVANNYIPVTISDNKIEASYALMTASFTITSKTGGYSIKAASGKYIGNTLNDNALKCSNTDKYTNSLEFGASDGDVYISSSSSYLRYNKGSSENRFRYFKSSSYTNQGAIQLYKYVAPSEEIVTISDLVGYSTYASYNALDFTDTGIRAFYASASGSTLTFHEVWKVPANTGVLLYKEGGANVDVPVYNGNLDALSDNVFVRGKGVPVSYIDPEDVQYYNYILFDGEDGLGFYKANNNMVATNRAYIHVPSVNGVKCFLIDLENDPTGIESIQNSKFKIQNEDAIYNLAGQRLSKMQKGINIINGKKVLR